MIEKYGSQGYCVTKCEETGNMKVEVPDREPGIERYRRGTKIAVKRKRHEQYETSEMADESFSMHAAEQESKVKRLKGPAEKPTTRKGPDPGRRLGPTRVPNNRA